ncbi:hypothetical protein [Streptomyces inusitatus]|nr:hypothetical protein [Streptomyces inusitatus]
MICHKRTAAVAFVAVFLTLSAAGAAQAVTAAAPQHPAKQSAVGEVDRNLLKPPPGGALQPVTDVVGKIVPGLPA